MTKKEIYCMGRAEYLAEIEGCSLTEGYARAEKENDNNHKVEIVECILCDRKI